MILLSHPLGNANVRHAALALAEAELLGEFWTALAPNANALGRGLSQLPGLSELRRRDVPEEVAIHTYQRPALEVLRLIATRVGINRLTAHETGFASIDAVFRDLDARVARRVHSMQIAPDGIYAYEDGALSSFKSARTRGTRTIYDLPIGYWRTARRIAQEEADRLPEWSGTLPGLRDSAAKLQRKDEELQLADTIIVASQFTASTLQDAPFPLPLPIIIPYGCDAVSLTEGAAPPPSALKGTALRVLFVGSLSQRKGIYELFKAVEACGSNVTLTLVGSRVGESPARDRYLEHHRWIPTLAHDAILQLMREHDVLVFPSVFEGFGLVITEALSQGLPVITTPRTGGADILTEGEDGFLVPIQDWTTIACRLERLHKDRDLLARMKQSACKKAAENVWEKYRARLAQMIINSKKMDSQPCSRICE